MKNSITIILVIGLLVSCSQTEQKPKNVVESKVTGVFPFKMPTEKPNIPLSSSTERMFEYNSKRVQDNELFSQFKYTRLKGFDYSNGDGTISRRDPSRPILVDGTFYIWYTKRDKQVPPVGYSSAKEATDVIPSTDWDLSDIWYATSEDGITWEEKGPAVRRPEKRDKYAVAHGLVTAKNPLGPFEKHPLNPVMNSGHETTYWPFKRRCCDIGY